MLHRALDTHLYSATYCLGKLRTLIRLIQLQCKYTHFSTLTTDYNDSRSNRENLPLPIQRQLSEKLKTFSNFLLVLECTLNLEHFEKKKGPHSSSISEVIDSERRGYLKVHLCRFENLIYSNSHKNILKTSDSLS